MKLVSLAPSNTEILYKLGADDLIAANTAYCDYPEEAKEKPNIGGWLNIFHEKVLDQKPDAVLTSSFLQDRIRKKLEDKGIEVLHFDPKTLDDVYDSIYGIGEFIGKEDKAYRVVESMKNEFSAIKEKVGSTGLKVYCEEWHKPPNIGGNWVPEIVDIAGGEEILIESGVESRPVGLDEVKGEEPDVVILHWCGFGSGDNTARIAEREGWDELEAVKEGNVFSIDDSLLNRPGPRLTQGCKRVSEVLSEVRNN